MGLVKNVNIKMDGRMAEAALPQPVQQRRAVPDNVPSGNDVQLQPADGGTSWGSTPSTSTRATCFGLQAGTTSPASRLPGTMVWAWLKSLGGHVRMGINSDDSQVARIQIIEVAEGGLADEAGLLEGDDAPGRMLPDDFLCGPQLPQAFLAVEDASVPRGGAVCLWGSHGNCH